MKKMLYFWVAYLLFFAIPFPCILYYTLGYPVADAARAAPPWPGALLAVSLLLWGLLAAAYAWTLLLSPFRARRRTRAIQRAAIRRRAHVLQAQDTGRRMRGWPVWSLTLAFDNLSGTPIQDTLLVVDSKPHLQRFGVDSRFDALLSNDPGRYPNVVLEAAMPEVDHMRVLRRVALGVLLLVLLAGYYAWCWADPGQGRGQDWGFLSVWHPLITMPASLCAYLLLGWLVARIIGIDRRADILNYRGIATEARILQVRQTGSEVNHQPQLEFHLAFEDRQGQSHTATVRKAVSLLDLAGVPRERVRILYHPDAPTQVAMPDG
ncbi:hypothetical protein KQ945_15815 [Bacillus subtilis subsp. subtilis]|nr:hypothetical protein [Bacillus subtilis subsp. subtilis]